MVVCCPGRGWPVVMEHGGRMCRPRGGRREDMECPCVKVTEVIKNNKIVQSGNKRLNLRTFTDEKVRLVMLRCPLPVLQRLADVAAQNIRGTFDVGNGTCHFERTEVGADRQMHAFRGLSQK